MTLFQFISESIVAKTNPIPEFNRKNSNPMHEDSECIPRGKRLKQLNAKDQDAKQFITVHFNAHFSRHRTNHSMLGITALHKSTRLGLTTVLLAYLA